MLDALLTAEYYGVDDLLSLLGANDEDERSLVLGKLLASGGDDEWRDNWREDVVAAVGRGASACIRTVPAMRAHLARTRPRKQPISWRATIDWSAPTRRRMYPGVCV